jgi:alanyl-tRNA synthetase
VIFYNFLVFHEIEPTDLRVLESWGLGNFVWAEVNAGRRARLSRAHSGAHLMALGLNHATSEYWRKDAPLDSLGRPDFDALFIKTAIIGDDHSSDTYRLGKSARKSGFDIQAFERRLEVVTATVNDKVNEWIDSDAEIKVQPGRSGLSAKRIWKCVLPEGLAEIPCGGTHVQRLGELKQAKISIVPTSIENEYIVVTAIAS